MEVPSHRVSDLLRRLKGVRKSQNGWEALCPAHDDQSPSLSVSEGSEGRVLLHCHAGCETETILTRVGFEWADLFVSPTNHSKIVATYPYHSPGGEMVFEVVRKEPKDFFQRRPDGAGGWLYTLTGVDRVPYRLPEVIEAVRSGEPVYVVEGEKDSDRLRSEGHIATTFPGGAGKWRDSYAKYFEGGEVIVIADNDPEGIAHAKAVAEGLRPVVRSVRTLRSLEFKDISDHLDGGLTLKDLIELEDAPDGTEDTHFVLLEDLLSDPTLFEPREWVIPHIAMPSELVVFAGAAKSGKSTILGQALAALSVGGEFLGERCTKGRAILVNLEEHLFSLHERFETLEVEGQHIEVMTLDAPNPPTAIKERVVAADIKLVLIDSLTEWARKTQGSVPNDGDNAGWASVMRPLVDLAHQTGVAVIVIHHARKQDGRYRGATEIQAAADVLLEFSEAGGRSRPSLRKIGGSGRRLITPIRVLWENGRYALISGDHQEPKLDLRIVEFVRTHAGSTKREIREGVQGGNQAIDRTLDELRERGVLEVTQNGQRHQYFVTQSYRSESSEGGTDHV